MLTAAALLELDFNQPSLDYHELMKLTKILTRDCTEDVENMYRRMCLMYSHIIVMIILKTLPTFIMKRMICGV